MTTDDAAGHSIVLGEQDARRHEFRHNNRMGLPHMSPCDLYAFFAQMLPPEWADLQSLRELNQCRQRALTAFHEYLDNVEDLHARRLHQEVNALRADNEDTTLLKQIQHQKVFDEKLETYFKKWRAFVAVINSRRDALISVQELEKKRNHDIVIPDYNWASGFVRDCQLWWNCSVTRYETIMVAWMHLVSRFNQGISRHIHYSNLYLKLRLEIEKIAQQLRTLEDSGVNAGYFIVVDDGELEMVTFPPGDPAEQRAKRLLHQIEELTKASQDLYQKRREAFRPHAQEAAADFVRVLQVLQHVVRPELAAWTTLKMDKRLNTQYAVDGTLVPHGCNTAHIAQYWPFELSERAVDAFYDMALAQHALVSLHKIFEQEAITGHQSCGHARISRILAFCYFRFRRARMTLAKGYEGPPQERQVREWSDTCRVYASLCFSQICLRQARLVVANPDSANPGYRFVPGANSTNYAAVAAHLMRGAIAQLEHTIRSMPHCTRLRLSFLHLPTIEAHLEELVREVRRTNIMQLARDLGQAEIDSEEGGGGGGANAEPTSCWTFFPLKEEAVFSLGSPAVAAAAREAAPQSIALGTQDSSSSSSASSETTAPKLTGDAVRREQVRLFHQLQKDMFSEDARKARGDLSACVPPLTDVQPINQYVFLSRTFTLRTYASVRRDIERKLSRNKAR